MKEDFLRQAAAEKRALELKNQPTTLRRCLGCDEWMHSTDADHRRCNPCKGMPDSVGSIVGRRITRTDRRKGVAA